jgi:uncharacterized delta-60 repeat protein
MPFKVPLPGLICQYMWSKAWWGTIFFISLRVSLFGQTNGSLDSTFNKTGKFFYQIDPESYFHRSTAVTATSERIYLLGIYSEGRSDKIGILALKPDGTFDPTFGSDGIQTIAVSTYDYATDVTVQPDGKILISGYTEEDIFVIRLHPDGSTDNSWGGDGVTITNVTTTWDRLHKIKCQPDGKVVVAGYCGTNVNDLVVVRYHANGTLDSTFGTGGKFIFDFNGNLDRIEGLALQPDGKIVIAGSGTVIGQSEGFVMRLTTYGALDPTFNATGIIPLEKEGQGVAVRSDGKILCASSYNDEGGVYAFNQDGSPDASFGVNGFASSGLRMFAGDIACTTDGNFYMFGYSYGSPSRDLVAVYYQRGGSLQTCFGNKGISKFDVGSEANEEWQGKDNTEDYLSKGVLQPDGKLLLAADNQSNEYVLTRLTGAGPSLIVHSNAAICPGEKYTFGSELLTTAGVYERTFTSEDGCEAREILKLSIRPSYNHQVEMSICPGESIVFDGKVLSSAGKYVGHLHSVSGCDSTVTVSLSIHAAYELSVDRTICQGESVVFGNEILTTSGTYTNRFSTIHGCDSTVTVSLSVNAAYELSIDRTICQGESVVFGSQLLTTAGTYTKRFNTLHGCDSIVHMSLSVIDLDNRINRNDNILIAVEPDAGYQWIDSEGVAIPGQNAQQFRPDESGTYSVKVEKNGCSVISESIGFSPIVLGIEETEAGSIYPNPSQNQVVLTLPEFRNPVSVLLKDVNGRTVRTWNNVEVYSGAQLDLMGVAKGVYFLQAGDKKRTFVNRIIKID